MCGSCTARLRPDPVGYEIWLNLRQIPGTTPWDLFLKEVPNEPAETVRGCMDKPTLTDLVFAKSSKNQFEGARFADAKIRTDHLEQMPQDAPEAIPHLAPMLKVLAESPARVGLNHFRCTTLIGKPQVESAEQSKILPGALPRVTLLPHISGVTFDRGAKWSLGERTEGPHRRGVGEKET
jgi:hypothetical protein